MRRKRVVFVVTGLGRGGAEHALLRFLSALDRERFEPRLVVLSEELSILPAFEAAGIRPICLGLRRGKVPLGLFRQVRRVLSDLAPDLVQGWMHHGNLAASYAAPKGVPVCWSVRDTPDPALGLGLLTRAVIQVSRFYLPRLACLFNVSRRSAEYGVQHLGWPAERVVVLPNGLDMARFRPDPEARRAYRSAMGWGEDTPVVGKIAWWTPVKNHRLFLEACARLLPIHPDLQVVLAGDHCTPDNPELAALSASLGLAGHLHALGPRGDLPGIYPALDAVALTSRSEGFPNVLLEAMACGVPVLSTDVGDAADLMGPYGTLLPQDPEGVAAALAHVLAPERRGQVEQGGRAWVKERYALDRVVRRLEATYLSLIEGRGLPGAHALPEALPDGFI